MAQFLLPCSYVKDQQGIASCTGCAVATAAEILIGGGFEASSLFVHYNTPQSTTPITIHNAVSAARRFGVCSEYLWPNDVTKVKMRPSQEAYLQARLYKIGHALPVSGYDDMVLCINRGWPCILSYEIALLGGLGLQLNRMSSPYHVSVIYGYDSARGVLFVRNSWGTSFGKDGDFELPWKEAQHRRSVHSCVAITK